jgi:hypothetical protein
VLPLHKKFINLKKHSFITCQKEFPISGQSDLTSTIAQWGMDGWWWTGNIFHWVIVPQLTTMVKSVSVFTSYLLTTHNTYLYTDHLQTSTFLVATYCPCLPSYMPRAWKLLLWAYSIKSRSFVGSCNDLMTLELSLK